jgi:arylsulfatase/arylsulfatase A
MLGPEERTLAEMLRDGGYATGIFGKWHLGDCHPMRAMDQGFEATLVHRGGGIGQPSDPVGGEGRYTDPILFRNGRRVETKGYCTDVYVDEAIKWMKTVQQEGRPFFAYIPTNAPHGPYGDVPEEPYRRYRSLELSNDDFPQESGHPISRPLAPDITAREYAMIENIDTAMGRLLAELDESGLARNTIVIFLHDNGPQHLRYNGGFRANKGSVREGGIRSPLFVRWPEGLVGGRIVTGVGADVDLAPTILEACGVMDGNKTQFDGQSLLPLLKGDQTEDQERTVVIQAHRGDVPIPWHNAMIRRGDWKLLNASGFGREFPPGEGPELTLELYDLANDPFEEEDLAARHPEVVQSLKKAYEGWFRSVGGEDPDQYAPPRISIGHPEGGTCVLTRQDWRGAGWGDRANGYWLLQVLRAGRYRVTIRPCTGKAWPPADSVTLRVDENRLSFEGDQAASEWVFPFVELKEGPLRLGADVRDEQGLIGAYQMKIEGPLDQRK